MYSHDVLDGGCVLLFSVGKVRVSRTILECDSIEATDLVRAFSRYLKGDWGDADAEQSLNNDVALATGGSAVGIYRSAEGTEFWIQKSNAGTRVMLPAKQGSLEASGSHR